MNQFQLLQVPNHPPLPSKAKAETMSPFWQPHRLEALIHVQRKFCCFLNLRRVRVNTVG